MAGLLGEAALIAGVGAAYKLLSDLSKNRVEKFEKRLANYEAINALVAKIRQKVAEPREEGRLIELGDELNSCFRKELIRARFLYDELTYQFLHEWKVSTDTQISATNYPHSHPHRTASGIISTIGRAHSDWDTRAQSFLKLGRPWVWRLRDWLVLKHRHFRLEGRHELVNKWRRLKERYFGPKGNGTS